MTALAQPGSTQPLPLRLKDGKLSLGGYAVRPADKLDAYALGKRWDPVPVYVRPATGAGGDSVAEMSPDGSTGWTTVDPGTSFTFADDELL